MKRLVLKVGWPAVGFNLSERERQLAGLFLRCLVRANEYGPVDVGAFIHSFREYLYGSFVPPEKKKPLRQCKCLYCGADFFTEKENRKFCSVLCVSEWNRKYRVAERK
ncbi:MULTISPECIES: hypothetical protein [Desulfofundulus]|uniref:hypothetical protein n=1 Tax=Desulfofundulus TaxID=2282741 RepID=UPI001F610BA9|nr:MULTISPECIES: hypothetical protein [Desulfofundulus]